MTDFNNAIYRALRAAYELRSEDCAELWKSAGFDLSNSKLRSLMLSPENQDYSEIATRRLKAFLRELLNRQGLSVPGMAIDMQVAALAEAEGIIPSGDPLRDAREIRQARRGGEWHD